MKPSEIIKDAGTGLPSHTKLWANIAYLSATLVFLRWGLLADEIPSGEYWLIYLGIVGAHTTASKWLSFRYGGEKQQQ